MVKGFGASLAVNTEKKDARSAILNVWRNRILTSLQEKLIKD